MKRQIIISLLILVALIVAGVIATAFASFGLMMLYGHDLESIMANAEGIMNSEHVNLTRWMLVLNHLLMFILPAIIFSKLVYKKEWIRWKAPNPMFYLLGGVLIFVAYPLVGYSYQINQMIPLPDILANMESSSAETIKRITTMESPMDFLFNIALIAIIPAIGEEWIFRGILQQSFSRLFKNPHVAIWIAAIIFSAFHLQFAGFLPRMVLGAILGYAYYYSGSLWVPILLHFLNNALPLVTIYFMGEDLGAVDPENAPVITHVVAFGSLLITSAVLYFMNRIKNNGESIQHS